MNSEFISIIIPVLNAERYIGDCLESIKKQSLPKNLFEVILIDSGSTDTTLKISNQFLSDLCLKIFIKPKIHVSSLRNFGVQQAKGDIIAFLDADCIVDVDWLKNGSHALKEGNERIGIAGAPYSIPSNSTWVAKAWALNSSNQIKQGEVEWLPAGNMFIKKKLFLNVGGFNEYLETNEDCDLCYRLKEKGYFIILEQGIKNTHLGTPQTLIGFLRKEIWQGKSVFLVFMGSGKKLKNLRAVLFAIFYIFILLGILISLSLLFIEKNTLFFSAFILLGIIVPFILGIKVSYSRKKYRYALGLGVLYLTYGIARALCIINLIMISIKRIIKNDWKVASQKNGKIYTDPGR